MRLMPMLLLLAGVGLATGCSGNYSSYTRVDPGPVPVADRGFVVQPSSAWNRVPTSRASAGIDETWTRNGPLLDTVAFVAGLADGESFASLAEDLPEGLPVFRADMQPQDLATLLEASYRAAGVTVFDVLAVEPTTFLDQPGVRMDFRYVPGDRLPRKGRSVLAVVGGKLYLMKLEGAADHYFDAALPEFDSMQRSASLR